MKKVVKIFIFIFIILLVFSAIVYIDYFCVKNKNIAPKIALKSEINSETTEYKAIFYKVWYCNSNKKYMIGSYDDDSSICPIKYIYDENGYYSNPQDIKISKRDIEVMTDNGYYTSEWGTRWDLMTIGIKSFGIVGKTFALTKENLYNELNSGHPVITSMRPGDFTTVGHFILLTGVEDDKIKVNDSNSKIRSEKLWDYDVIAPQIKGQWSFSLVS